jgi:hypothetical protein
LLRRWQNLALPANDENDSQFRKRLKPEDKFIAKSRHLYVSINIPSPSALISPIKIAGALPVNAATSRPNAVSGAWARSHHGVDHANMNAGVNIAPGSIMLKSSV